MATRAAPLPALPLDVRLMNAVSRAVFMLALGVLAAAGVAWLLRSPWFTIRAIELHGDLQRNSPATVRANTVPKLSGNLFSVDLAAAKKVFEGVPWVRQAVVRRVWPNRLAVRLTEHQPAARWSSDDGNERLVNLQGEVFEANVGDVEADGLPLLGGPDGTAAEVLAMYRTLDAIFQRIDRRVEELTLSGRGSWHTELEDGAVIELGRGSAAEVARRTERFAATLAQVTGNYRNADLLRADLRHAGGYAVKLRGWSEADPPPAERRQP